MAKCRHDFTWISFKDGTSRQGLDTRSEWVHFMSAWERGALLSVKCEDCGAQLKMGNTTLRRLGGWNVRVIRVGVEKRLAMRAWNGNPGRLYFERDFKRCYTKPTKAYPALQESRSKGRWL